MTLTDFLLERIAEDREALPNLGDEVEVIGGRFVNYRERVLLECEAKRRIVERAQRASQAFDQSINPTTSGVATTMDLVLADLALPYADHPDYDESWRL